MDSSFLELVFHGSRLFVSPSLRCDEQKGFFPPSVGTMFSLHRKSGILDLPFWLLSPPDTSACIHYTFATLLWSNVLGECHLHGSRSLSLYTPKVHFWFTSECRAVGPFTLDSEPEKFNFNYHRSMRHSSTLCHQALTGLVLHSPDPVQRPRQRAQPDRRAHLRGAHLAARGRVPRRHQLVTCLSQPRRPVRRFWVGRRDRFRVEYAVGVCRPGAERAYRPGA